MAKPPKDGSNRRFDAALKTARRPWKGGQTGQRVSTCREAIAQGLSATVVARRLSKEWNCAERTVRSYIMAAREDIACEFNGARKNIMNDTLLRLERFYRKAMEDKNYSAAGKYFDRVIQLFGLESARRIEVTGRDGGPIEEVRKVDLTGASTEDLAALARVLGVDVKGDK